MEFVLSIFLLLSSYVVTIANESLNLELLSINFSTQEDSNQIKQIEIPQLEPMLLAQNYQRKFFSPSYKRNLNKEEFRNLIRVTNITSMHRISVSGISVEKYKLPDWEKEFNKMIFGDGQSLAGFLNNLNYEKGSGLKETIAATNNRQTENELYFIDYSKNHSISDDEDLSANVSNVIKRELAMRPTIKTRDLPRDSVSVAMAALTKKQESNNSDLEIKVETLDFIKKAKTIPEEGDVELLNEKIMLEGSSEEGFLHSYSCDGGCGVTSFKFEARGFIPVNFDVARFSHEQDFTLNVIQVESFVSFVSSLGADVQGSVALFKVDKKVTNIDLDKNYYKKIFLNEKLELVNTGAEFDYVLFVNVDPGNVTIRYAKDGVEFIRVSNIPSGEMLFEDARIIKNDVKEISFASREMLSNEEFEIIVREEDLKSFSSSDKIEGLSPSILKMTSPLKNILHSDYLKMDLPYLNLFIGLNNSKKALIPSQSYFETILNEFSISSLNNYCLIELSLDKNLINISLNQNSGQEIINFETYMLGRDGRMYKEVHPDISKIYLLGDRPGIVHFKTENVEGKHFYDHTFCATTTYLLEQF